MTPFSHAPPVDAAPVRSRGRHAPWLAAALLAAVVLPGAPPAGAAEDKVPDPPKIFFPEPDEKTAQEIDEIIDNSFGDQTKVLTARDLLVKRYHLWSVPALVRRVEAAQNESETWNAALTLGSIAATSGPAPQTWTAIAPLARLLKSPEPFRRTFAALALGSFYGPDAVGPPPSRRAESESDPQAKARAALVEAVQGLVAALSDANIPVRIAAAFALGKTGGMTTWHSTLDKIHAMGSDPSPESEMALLLALGLLPGSDDNRPATALVREVDRRVRAAAALSISLRHVAIVAGGATRDPQTASRAQSLEKTLVNTQIRLNEWDGAEATFARGVLGLVSPDPNAPVWRDLYELAINTTTEKRTATAAAQALLFCPAECEVRRKMADFAGRDNSGHTLKETVLAAFLVTVGSEGTPAGVHACARFLKHMDRDPRGKVEYDVRYHAAVGLVRALEAGRIPWPDARTEAVEALMDAVRVGLPHLSPGVRGFRDVLREIVEPQQNALVANAAARLPAGSADHLEDAFSDPDALLAHDPIDVVLDRLNDAMRDVLGLDNLPKPGGGLNPGNPNNKEATPLRFLLGWVTQRPYFSRVDLYPLRGRRQAPPPPPAGDPHEIDR